MAHNQHPLVSVFTLIYNTGPYVIEALKSVRAQTYPNIEHIIIDDCSQDDSADVVWNWIQENQYPVTHFVRHTQNQGVCKSVNEAFRLAKGKYIAGISDDLWLPNQISHHVDLLEASGDSFALSYSDSPMIDEQNQQYYGTLASKYYDLRYKWPSGYLFEQLLVENFIPSHTVLMRRDYVISEGLHDESLHFEDHDMWLRLSKNYQFVFSEYMGTLYRLRRGSLSKSLKKPAFIVSYLKMYEKHVNYSHKTDLIIRDKTYKYIEYLYKVGDKNSLIHAKNYYKYFKNAHILYYSILFRFPFCLYVTIRKLHNKLKK